MLVPVAVRVEVAVPVLVRVLVFVGGVPVLVGVLVGQGCWLLISRPHARSVPMSTGWVSITLSDQVPMGFSPLNAERGLLGRKAPPEVGGQTAPMLSAALSSSLILEKSSWLPQILSIKRTVVPCGEVRLICRSLLNVWLIVRPTRSRSEIVPIPPMVRVEVIPARLLSGMLRGTLVEVAATWHTGVLVPVAVDVPVGVIVAVFVEVPVEVLVPVGGVPVKVAVKVGVLVSVGVLVEVGVVVTVTGAHMPSSWRV